MLVVPKLEFSEIVSIAFETGCQLVRYPTEPVINDDRYPMVTILNEATIEMLLDDSIRWMHSIDAFDAFEPSK